MAVLISGGSVFGVEGLSRADPDLGEARHQVGLGRIGRAELQDEVQDVEELERLPLVGSVSGLMKSIAGAAAGGGWPRKAESGCAL